MGVMSCYRSNCEGIMCDIHIDEIGYVCYECEREFKEYLKTTGLNPTTRGEILNELKKFMDTEKGIRFDTTEMSVEEFLNQHRR